MESDRNKKWIGIEIGGTKLQIVVCDAAGSIVKQLRFKINPADGATGIQKEIEKNIVALGIQTIAATGVGFGGPVNWQTGIIETSHQVEGWSGFNLKSWLENLTQAPVLVDNDANVAALAEAIHGSGMGHDPVFYITIGSGIGGGLVAEGKIYHGAMPGEVEIGHIRLDKTGATLESRCSGWAIDKIVRSYIEQHPHSMLAGLAIACSGPEAALLKPALEGRDTAAAQIINSIADDLAFALSHAVHLFHPRAIIIGGGLSLLGEALRQPIANCLPHYVMKAFLPTPEIKLALLGEAVVPVGALELARKALVQQ